MYIRVQFNYSGQLQGQWSITKHHKNYKCSTSQKNYNYIASKISATKLKKINYNAS